MCLFSADVQETKWLGSPITGEPLGGGPAKGLLDQRQEGDTQIGLRSGGSVVWKKRGDTNPAPPQIVLLRTYVSSNQIPGWFGGADPSPTVGTNGYLNMLTTAQAIVHAPRIEVVTNYVLGFWQGTNAVELLTAEKH